MRVARLWLVAVAVALSAGCSGGADGPEGVGPSLVFTSVSLTPATPTVVVGATQQLTATAQDQNGGSMSGATFTYQSSDVNKATVSTAGVVTGVAAGTARVTASGTIGTVTKTAFVDVTVTAPAPVFTSVTISPASPSVNVGLTAQLTAVAKDQNGGNMSGATFTYESSDQSKATVTNAGVVTGVAAGTARITATGTVGTVTKTAFVDVTVTPSAGAAVTATLGSTFDPQTVTISRGGSVTWTFAALHNVTFGGTTGAPQNIPDQATGSAQRQFNTAGTFNYQCTLHAGMQGTVIVQ